MVTSWLLNSLSKNINGSALYSSSAQALWTDLEDRFRQTKGAQLYHLKKQINDLNKGTSGIPGYFTKFKMLWDDIDSLYNKVTCTCTCTCAGKKKMLKSQ